MHKNQPAALLAAGKISDSPLRRWPALSGLIGLTWASPSGLATKFVRILKLNARAGPCADLHHYRLWIVHAPGSPPSQLLNLALATGLPLSGRVIAVLDERAAIEQFMVLREAGAHPATFWPAVPRDASSPFFVEGQKEAVKPLQTLLRRAGIASVRLRTGTKSRFLAAKSLAGSLPVPVLEGIVRCLEHCGVARAFAQRLALNWAEQQLRAYAASGRRAWSDPARSGRLGLAEAGLENLRRDDQALAYSLGKMLESSRRLMAPRASSRAASASKE